MTKWQVVFIFLCVANVLQSARQKGDFAAMATLPSSALDDSEVQVRQSAARIASTSITIKCVALFCFNSSSPFFRVSSLTLFHVVCLVVLFTGFWPFYQRQRDGQLQLASERARRCCNWSSCAACWRVAGYWRHRRAYSCGLRASCG